MKQKEKEWYEKGIWPLIIVLIVVYILSQIFGVNEIDPKYYGR